MVVRSTCVVFSIAAGNNHTNPTGTHVHTVGEEGGIHGNKRLMEFTETRDYNKSTNQQQAKNDALLLPADITIKHHKASKFVCVMPTLAAMMLLKELPMVKEMLVAIVKKEYTLGTREKLKTELKKMLEMS